MTNIDNKKHFLIFYSYNSFVKISPREWARFNQGLFSQYGFTNKNDDHPTTNQVLSLLVNNYNFKRVEDEEIVIHYNFSKSLKF